MQFDMLGVLKQIELCGSTMGSRREFVEMLSFVEQHKLHVDVDCVLSGLSQAEQGFEKMREGKQFGKIVIQI
jgi:zinc-binding alcohol dehydrogenase/oxidoreductase